MTHFLFSQKKILNHGNDENFFRLFHRHLQPQLIAKILLNIPEKCIFTQVNYSILEKIIQHTSPVQLNHFIESLENSQELIDSKLLHSILQYSSPNILIETLPHISKAAPDFLYQLNLNSRLKSLEMLKEISVEEASKYLEYHHLLEAHHLYPFLEHLVSLNPEYLDAHLQAQLKKLHFMDWIRVCFQHDLVNFANIYHILSQPIPKSNEETLRYLLTSPNFRDRKQLLFSAFLENEEKDYLCEVIKCLDEKRLIITPELFKMLCKKRELNTVFASLNILLSEELYMPSIRYIDIFELLIASEQNQNILTIIANLRHYPMQINLEGFLRTICTHHESQMIVDLSKNTILTRLFIHHRHINVFHQLLASPIFPEIAKALILIEDKKLFSNNHITKIDYFIKALLNHPKNHIILKLIPKVIEIEGKEDVINSNLFKILDCNFDWINEFVSQYNQVSQIILNKFSSNLYDYPNIKIRLAQCISLQLIPEDDLKTQSKFFEISHELNLISFIQTMDQYKIVVPELKEAFIHTVIHHPKAEEINHLMPLLAGFKIDFSSPQFKQDFMDIIHSPSPFDSSYLYGLAHQAKFLPVFDRTFLKNIMDKHPSLWEISSKISTHIEIFSSLEPNRAFELFVEIAKSNNPKDLIAIYKIMNLNADIEPIQLLEIIKKVRVHRSINDVLPILYILNQEGFLNYETCDQLLKISSFENVRYFLIFLKSRHLFTLENILLYFSHPDTANLAYFANILNEYDLINDSTISTLLVEKNALHGALFLDIARKNGILSKEFLLEFLSEKDSLFAHEAVRKKFTQINSAFFTAINLRQLISLSKHLKHDPINLASEVLRTCNQLLQHHSSSQSTHLASVHESASLSAKSLFERYGHMHLNLSELSEFLAGEIKKLENNFENQSALRCIRLLSNPFYLKNVDAISGVNIQQLFCFCIIAIQDSSIADSTIETRVNALAKGLFDIIRGNNVDKYSKDESDSQICEGGIFNKLIESFSSIHPDCKQVAVNLNAASLKLPRLIINTIKEFLIGLEAHSQESLTLIHSLIDELLQGNIAPIWPSISTQIMDAFFEEFKTLFTDKHDPKFLSLIECGQNYTEVDELKEFAQELKESKIRQFHLVQLSLFARKNEDALAQHAFDKVYGVVLRRDTPSR